MPKPQTTWKKGRGKLGLFEPLLGSWTTEAAGPKGGRIRCTRTFVNVLGGAYVQLAARWEIPGKPYEELALFAAGDDGRLAVWSFTSDGKRSQGRLADATDVHPEAIGFEAQMPAGLARQVYWPAAAGGFHWAVESRTKQGWNRFVEHHYTAA
jgi:hypothetical protein